mmetsp:Transcript_27816/g.41395  ORF Transcript_27816/g.41395 Transcript_27816/m.41395 type:complete len:113 (-) Transcript_27816:631-969(-)
MLQKYAFKKWNTRLGVKPITELKSKPTSVSTSLHHHSNANVFNLLISYFCCTLLYSLILVFAVAIIFLSVSLYFIGTILKHFVLFSHNSIILIMDQSLSYQIRKYDASINSP